MPAQSTAPLLDRIIPGGLTAWLRSHRDRGTSLDDIAAALAVEHDHKVSRETVRQWCIERDIPTGRESAA